jgi:hypothetical protein
VDNSHARITVHGTEGARAHTSMGISHRVELSDPSFVNLVGKRGGARAPCDNRHPDSGLRLSKQFEGLQLRTSELRERIAFLDHMNADPTKVSEFMEARCEREVRRICDSIRVL